MLSNIRILLFKLLSQIEKLWYWFTAKTVKSSALTVEPKVAIIIVVYNAFDYLNQCLKSLSKTNYKNYQIYICDNNSSSDVKEYLKDKVIKNEVAEVVFSKENLFFSGGNNKAAGVVSKDTDYLLLLNSDTEVLDGDWLSKLVSVAPKKGVISYGFANLPFRPDGWAYLVSKDLYQEIGGINEYYQMNWGISELTAKILALNHKVKIVMNPEKYIQHFGGKSYGYHKKKVKFNQMGIITVFKLYIGRKIEYLKLK